VKLYHFKNHAAGYLPRYSYGYLLNGVLKKLKTVTLTILVYTLLENLMILIKLRKKETPTFLNSISFKSF
jgi:hypothetical protein